jgi:autotransporter-associated beta strand protein
LTTSCHSQINLILCHELISKVFRYSKEGRLTISGGETYVTGSTLKTAVNAGSTARIDMSGGYLNVFGGAGVNDCNLDIGAAGKCILEMTGGQIDAEVLRIGPSGGATPAVSKLIMNGGRLNVFGPSYLSDTAVGTGAVQLVNGVLSVKQLRGWWGQLEVTFDGGTLEARQNEGNFIYNNNIFPNPGGTERPLYHILTARGLVIDSAGFDVGTPLALPDAPGEHGKVTKKGAGKFLINGTTTFTGPIAVEKGEVEVGGGGMVTLQGGVQVDGVGLLDLHNRNQDFTLGAGSASRVDGTVQLATGKALIVPGTASLSGTGTVERVTLQSGSTLAKDKATGAALLHIANLTMATGTTVALTGYTEAEFKAGIAIVNGTTLSVPRGSQMTFTLNGVARDYVALRTVPDGAGGYQVVAYSFIPGTLVRVL